MHDEYLTPEEAYYMVKVAQEEQESTRDELKRKALIGLKYVGGLGGGIALGAGTAAASDAIYKKITGKPIPAKYLFPIGVTLGSLGTKGITKRSEERRVGKV